MLLLKEININSFKGINSVKIQNCGRLNAIVGKNNSGKSSILHAIDMAGLALEINNWNRFQPKLHIKDMFSNIGEFFIELKYNDNSSIKIKSNPSFAPVKSPAPNDQQKFKSILIWPNVAAGAIQRTHRTPRWIVDQIENRNFAAIDSLQILFAIKYYASREERGLSMDSYNRLIDEIKNYFPEIQNINSDRTEHDIATLTYEEYGKQLDILYSGSGLKHFVDILLKATISGANIILIDEPEMGLHPDLQRKFLSYLNKIAEEKDIQIFIATHSPVLLNYADLMSYYRITNSKGNREVTFVSPDAIHTILSDMGIRPSDVFNQDICLLVEGSSDVIFFEYIIQNLYSEEFKNISVGVVQYGGSSADGIISGSIDISNIIPAQKYTYWIRDRDAKPTENPSINSTKFKNVLENLNLECHILQKRELEYYFPEKILQKAQQGDCSKTSEVVAIRNGSQDMKFRDAAKNKNICIPHGKYLKRLLKEVLVDKEQIDSEIKGIIENKLILWKREILGE